MRTFRRLLGFLRKPWKLVLLAVTLGWATAVSWFALISTSAYLISNAALQPSIAELQVAIVGVRFFGISRAVFRYLERLVSHTVTFELLARLRTWFYERIEPQAPAGLASESSGDLLSRIVSDVETLQDFYVRTVAPPLVALLSSIGVLWFFGRWSVWFALIILFFQLTAGVVVPLLVRKMSARVGVQIINIRSRLASLIVSGVQGSAEIAVFEQKDRFIGWLQDLVDEEERAEQRNNLIQGGYAAMEGLLINLMAVVLLAAAVPIVRSGGLDGRLLAVVILGAIASFEAISPLPQAVENLDGNIEAGQRLFELADAKILVPEGGKSVEKIEQVELEVKNLSFAYSRDEGPVFAGFDLHLPPGKKLAILGPSGVGKSTIANLLLRFWDYSQGEILVNGQDIRTFDAQGLRGLIGYLPQNPFLFNTSIAENIRIGDLAAGSERVRRAAQSAGLHQFIEGLPEKYDTIIGEFGELLSGGQRQRLALARALLREVPIYLFDEPTANLDWITERALIETILELVFGKSLIWITHRLTGLEAMDEIVVLADGKIIERGSHAELIQVKGEYARMVQMNQDGLNL